MLLKISYQKGPIYLPKLGKNTKKKKKKKIIGVGSLSFQWSIFPFILLSHSSTINKHLSFIFILFLFNGQNQITRNQFFHIYIYIYTHTEPIFFFLRLQTVNHQNIAPSANCVWLFFFNYY